MNGTISVLVLRCLEAFAGVENDLSIAVDDVKKKIPEGGLTDELGRFRIWVGNSGAHRRGMSSLDYKLREASHIQTRAVKLLENILTILAEMKEIIDGDRPACEDFSDSDSDDMETDFPLQNEETPFCELMQLLLNLADINTFLMRLSIAIRNPAPHDHFEAFAKINVSHYEMYDNQHVRAKFPSLEGNLIERLSSAISRRRQYLTYRKCHRARLGEGLDPDSGPSAVDFDRTVISSLPPEIKNDPTALLFETYGGYDDAVSITSYSSSHTNLAKLRPPPMPEDAEYGQPFECPLCYRFTIVMGTHAWVKHVYQDLRPYTCTFNDCKTPHKIYESRHEWFDHEIQAHRTWWDCVDGCSKNFRSLDQFRTHLQQAHVELGTGERLENIIRVRRKQADPDTEAQCPLCNAKLGSLMKLRHHLGRHQEELALFSLPSHLLANDSDDNDQKDSEDPDTRHTQDQSTAVLTTMHVGDDGGMFVDDRITETVASSNEEWDSSTESISGEVSVQTSTASHNEPRNSDATMKSRQLAKEVEPVPLAAESWPRRLRKRVQPPQALKNLPSIPNAHLSAETDDSTDDESSVDGFAGTTYYDRDFQYRRSRSPDPSSVGRLRRLLSPSDENNPSSAVTPSSDLAQQNLRVDREGILESGSGQDEHDSSISAEHLDVQMQHKDPIHKTSRSTGIVVEHGKAQRGQWSAENHSQSASFKGKGAQTLGDSQYSEKQHDADILQEPTTGYTYDKTSSHATRNKTISHRGKGVGFMTDPVISVSRPVSNAESWALYDFEMHARKCAHCHDPYDVHRHYEQLCQLGHRLAQDVCSYVYNHDAITYSTKEEDHKPVRVEIPSTYVEVSGLLKAVERSLIHRSRKPFVSMDPNYHPGPSSEGSNTQK